MKAVKLRISRTLALLTLAWAATGSPVHLPAALADADRTEFAVIGDAGKWHKYSKRSRDSILRAGIRRLILPGDNLYGGSYEKAWKNWRSEGFLFDLVAIGNHHGGYRKELGYFDLPGEYYSKVLGGARFIVLNSDHQRTSVEQARFLEEELSKADETFVFVVLHHPPLTVSGKHTWREKMYFHAKVRPVLLRNSHKITAMLLGHDHHAGFYRFDDLIGIVSGSARAVRLGTLPVNNTQEGVAVRTDFVGSDGPYWVRLRLRPARSVAEIDFVIPGDKWRDDFTACSFQLTTGEAPRRMTCPLTERIGPSIQRDTRE